MKYPVRSLALGVSTLVAFGAAAPARAQTYEIVSAFTVPSFAPAGGLTEGSSGTFCGTTERGGANGAGTVYRIDSAGTLTTLHTFSGYDGDRPLGRLVRTADGSLYGVTNLGGANGFGTIFKIDPAGVFTTLHAFTGSGAVGDGSSPTDGLVLATDGKFYGTTQQGGLAFSDLGTVFAMDVAGNVSILHSFGGSDGVYPTAALVQGTDGKLYGTTRIGGSGSGTVFQITTGGTFVSLKSFAITDGATPSAPLVQAADGKFYGTTSGGGSAGFGTIFKIDSAGSFLTIKHLGASDGHAPAASLIQASDGKLYGTTVMGGTNDLGTVFRVDTAGTTLTTLHPFTGTDGSYPLANVIQGTDGNFYGTAHDGGANGPPYGSGTVFKMTSAGILTTLHDFGGPGTGYEPESSVMQASDGNLYGTTYRGGPGNFGTIFKLTLAGSRTVLHNFTETDGANPWAQLVQATDGRLYGTTERGGASQWGVAFRIDGAGTFNLLHSFDGTDALEVRDAALIQAPSPDLKLYGTSYGGGTNNFGNVFKMDTAGNVTPLHSFNLSEGALPRAALVVAPDGNFYGTTESGGDNAQGNVFKMTPAGAVSTIHQFNHTAGADDDGLWPAGGLIRASDGKFYGTTRQGGTTESGTAFRVDSAGNYATLHSFNGADGREPYGNLLQGADGKLYGATYGGGASGRGTVFRLDTTGNNFTTLHSFTGADGNGPVGGLIQASDGKLYGVTNGGGPGAAGVVFRVTLASCTPPSATITAPSPLCPNAVGQVASVPDAGPGATYSWSITNGTITAGSGTRTITFSAGATGSVTLNVTVTSGSGCAASGSASLPISAACGSASRFFPVTPCRLADTRNPDGPVGGPALVAATQRSFPLTGTCGVPAGARALSLNVTVTAATSAGDLKLFAAGTSVPVATAISYHAVQARANNTIAAPSTSGNLAVFCNQPSGTTHLVVDVNGYFK